MTAKTYHISISPHRPATTSRRPVLIARLRQLASVVKQWNARSRERRALFEIADANDVHLLSDIGASRAQALYEAGKPFWKR